MKRKILIFVICLVILCLAGGLVHAQSGGSGAWVFNDANQTCATGATCVLTFNSEQVDTDDYHSVVINTNRLVAPWDGWYIISAHVDITGSTGGTYRQLKLRDNAGTVVAEVQVQQNTHTSASVSMSFATVMILDAGDWVEFYFNHNAGVDLTVNSLSRYSPEFRIAYLGYPTPVPTDTPIPTPTATPTPGPTPTLTPTPLPEWVITDTLSSGTVVMYDRSETLGDRITAGVLLAVAALVIFGVIQREAHR